MIHVDGNGNQRPCRAEKGNCPYSSYRHFTTKEEADDYFESEINAENLYNAISDTDKEVLLDEFKIYKGRGPSYTEYKTMIREMNKNREFFSDSSPIKAYFRGSTESPRKQEELYHVLSTVMPESYVDGKAKNKNSVPVHLVLEDSYHYYVWTNSSNQRDVIVYDKAGNKYNGEDYLPLHNYNKKSSIVEHIEVKDLEKGAQVPASRLKRTENENGEPRLNLNSDDLKPEIKEALKDWDPRVNSYSNKVLLTSDKAIDYLVDEYKNKDTRKIVLYKKDGTPVDIVLPRGQLSEKQRESIREQFKENNISVDINLRNNKFEKSDRKPKDEDIELFKKNYGSMFKDGIAKETFKLSDLNYPEEHHGPAEAKPNQAYVRTKRKFSNTSYMRSGMEGYKDSTPFIRIGDFYLKFKNENYIDPRKEYSIRDFKIATPQIMGQIKND